MGKTREVEVEKSARYSMMNLFYAFLHCLISTGVGGDLLMINCPNAPIRTTIDCGHGSVIQIYKANQIFKRSCAGDIQSKCVRKREDVFKECQGKSTCEVDAKLSGGSPYGCQSFPINIPHIQYSCYNLSSPSTVLVPICDDVSAETLHIFNPGFPKRITDSVVNFSCVVKPPRNSYITQITLNVILLEFAESNEYCSESLNFEEFGNKMFCGDNNGWNLKTNHAIRHTLNFKYQKRFIEQGGIFWIQLKGYQDTQRVELKLSCTDLSLVPEYSTSLTDSAPTAAAITDRRSYALEGGALYGIVGSSVAVIIIIVALVIFLFVHRKRNRSGKKASGERQDSMENQKSNPMFSYVPDIQNVRQIDKTSALLSKEVKTDDNTYQEELTGMPATVRESKRNEVISLNVVKRTLEVPSKEKVISVVGEEGSKATATNGGWSGETSNNNQENDETIMCENNDIYEGI